MQEKGRFGLALSLAVLGMEEIGKMWIIDGLLFAKPNDERSQLFKKGFRSHGLKLEALDVFPFMVNYLATLDPRYNNEQRFNQTLAIVIKQYKEQRQSLESWLGPSCDLRDLDLWKQKGFYAHVDAGRFVRPSEIDENFATGVVELAFRMVDVLDFLLKSNMGRYKELIASLRRKMTEEQWNEIHSLALRIMENTFMPDAKPDGSPN